jgi:peroxiredoxin Q/BCP
MSISIGDKAPEFTLADQYDNLVSLQDILGQQHVILYFYPMDETPGCIAEACAFRDKISEFEGYNCKIIGISKDSVNSHAKFSKHYKLPFTLLSDKQNVVRKLYGVESSIMGLLPGRKTFLIDKQGIITHIFDYQFKATKHVHETLSALANE